MPRLGRQAHVIKSDFITYNLIGFIDVQLIKGRNLSFYSYGGFNYIYIYIYENNLKFEPKNTWALIFQSPMLQKIFT